MHYLFLSLLILLTSHVVLADVEAVKCDEVAFPEEISEFKALYNKNFWGSQDYYIYFEASTLQELQVLKNCLDYSKCGTARESIVDDPKNFRMHIWSSFKKTELSNFLKSCPINDLHQKVILRKKDQQGEIVSIAPSDDAFAKSFLSKKASPAIFHRPSPAVTKRTVEKVGELLKQSKIKDAQNLVLYTWGIDLKGYKLNYTGLDGSAAVTHHGSKKIEYGKAWINEPCEYIRMLRHEAEHVAQMNRSKFCDGDHNFSEHKMRERAAHLNDALFIKSICPGTKIEKMVEDTCLNKFKKNYFNK